VYIFGTYDVREDAGDRARSSLKEHEARTRAEPGCLMAAVMEDLEDPLVLYSMQRWESEAALQAHRDLPHVRALDGSASVILARPFVLEILRPHARAGTGAAEADAG
jgi:quinol monooxygenase YgiN